MSNRSRSLVRMFKALSNPNRLRLFTEIVGAQERSFDDGHTCFLHTIMERLDIGAPTVSHHLKELVNAELILTDREGKYVTCRANPKALDELSAFFDRSS